MTDKREPLAYIIASMIENKSPWQHTADLAQEIIERVREEDKLKENKR